MATILLDVIENDVSGRRKGNGGRRGTATSGINSDKRLSLGYDIDMWAVCTWVRGIYVLRLVSACVYVYVFAQQSDISSDQSKLNTCV